MPSKQHRRANAPASHHPLLTQRLLGAAFTAALLLAPLGAPVAAQVPAVTTATCGTDGPSTGAYTVTYCITAPGAGAVLTGDRTVTASVTGSAGAPRVQRVAFFLDGGYLLTDFLSTYSFILPTARFVDGSHNISVEAFMSDGFTTGRTAIGVTFSNGVTSPPVNSGHFTPTSGRPAAPGSAFVVAATGDAASGESAASSVSSMLVNLDPNLFLYLGDVYDQGTPTEFYNWYGTSSKFFGRLRSITDPTVGNHEYLGNGRQAPGYFDYWDNIPNYYSFNAGGWHFISLNSMNSIVPITAGSAQYRWLQADLSALPAGTCTMVFYHHPLFNIGPEGSNVALWAAWQLMVQKGVKIVLNGHDHDYQRWKPLDGNGNVSGTGITEFVAGAGGHGTQDFAASDARVARALTGSNAFGALVFSLDATGAHFKYLNRSGSTLDSGTIPCSSDPLDVTISGNAGVGAATLSYTGGSATADGSGNYAFTVPSGWSGTVTPSRAGYAFSPSQRSYTSVLLDQPGQSYSASLAAGTAQVNVTLGGAPAGTYLVPASSALRQSYSGVDNGPVLVQSANGVPIVASERVAYFSGGRMTSFSELMGLPASQLTTSYVLPWYNNAELNTQLRFGNMGSTSTTVSVRIGGALMGTYALAPQQSMRISYAGVNSGPVVISSSGNVPIIASERVAFVSGGTATSFSEVMGLPANRLTTSYVLPWYNNAELNTQLRFANLGTAGTTVTVRVGGVVQGSYALGPQQSLRVSYPGLNNGPVVVSSSGGVKIVASQRVAYNNGSAWTSYSEMMGLPQASLGSDYWMPLYDNVTGNDQIRFGNLGSTSTTVTVTVGGVVKGSYVLGPQQSLRVSYPSLNDGPVRVSSSGSVPIIVAHRVAYTVSGNTSSFAEMMGLPAAQLGTSYVMPWYNDLDLDTQLRFSAP